MYRYQGMGAFASLTVLYFEPILKARLKTVRFSQVASAILSTMAEWYFSQMRGTA